MAQITVRELEEKILALEKIDLIVRLPANTLVDDFEYTRKSTGSTTITDWLDVRIKPLIGNGEVLIRDGSGAKPHGLTKLSTLRAGY